MCLLRKGFAAVRSTFDQWLAFQTGLRDSSRATYRTMAESFLSWCDRRGVRLMDLTPALISEYMGEAMAENSNGVINGRVNMLRAFFTWAVARKLMESNPCQRALLPRLQAAKPEKVAFTEPEYRRVLAELERGEEGGYEPYWPTATRLGWHTGLRMGDVACLSWPQVNLAAGLITVNPRKRQASGQRLEIPIEPELFEHLSAVPLNPPCERVLPGMCWQFGDNRARLSSRFALACERAGLPNHSYHSLRHGFVTRLLNAGIDSVLISSMTGQSIEQIRSYAHVSPAAKAAALAASRTNAQLVTS